MIKIENVEIIGWEHAIRGMRNPKNSWDRMDSISCSNRACDECPRYTDANCPGQVYTFDGTTIAGEIGPNDLGLMKRLAKGGPVHAKYRRMITVYLDITAPLYWWKEFDTYKVGTVANSCSTMHKIHDKEFELSDFSHDNLMDLEKSGAGFDYECIVRDPENRNYLIPGECVAAPMECLKLTIDMLNVFRHRFLKTNNKDYWWQMIQLLPSSYNQKRTIMLNYEVLVGMYEHRKSHKLDEWREFCEWVEGLPYSELITGKFEKGGEGGEVN
jgi:hypothetical protein